MIEIVNLNKVYSTAGKDIEALKNVNLTIDKGEVFGIIGLSGAGKSSLVRCINMLEKPSSGNIFIDGVDITIQKPGDLREMRKNIGMIFQHFNLLMNSTVYDNIAFPLRISKLNERAIEKRVNELLDVVELKDKRNSYPSQLSGGQKQRIGIARALANNPGILLSDEATSALDPSTTESILTLLKDINKEYKITILVITHEMQVVKQICRKVAVMDKGCIVETGRTIDVFSDPKTDVVRTFLKDTHTTELEALFLHDTEIPGKILKITYNAENTKKPVLSSIVKQFGVDANIICGNIERIQDSHIGSLYIKLSGSDSGVNDAIRYLQDNKVRIEVIKNDAV